MTDTNQLPPLPTPKFTEMIRGVPCITVTEHEHLMRAYALQARAQVQGEPVFTSRFGRVVLSGPREDVEFAVRHLPDVDDKTTTTQPAQATQADVMDERHQAVDQIMEQAQVFASAWALVGGRFDSGDALDDAHEAKEELREMVCSAILALRPVQVPMTEEQIDKLQWGPSEGNPMTFADGLREFARSVEAHHGITAQAKKETL